MEDTTNMYVDIDEEVKKCMCKKCMCKKCERNHCDGKISNSSEEYHCRHKYAITDDGNIA